MGAPHAAIQLAEGPKVEAARKQPEDSELAIINGPPTDQCIDQAAVEACEAWLESG